MKRQWTMIIITMVSLPILGVSQTLWVDHPDNPVFAIDGEQIWDCCVLEMNDTLKMWYSADAEGIFYAWSTDDGMTWDYLVDPVVHSGSMGSWEYSWLDMPRVLFDGSIYRMWYLGEDSDDYSQVGLATSLNGIDWTKSDQNPVFGPGESGAWDGGEVSFGGVIHDGTQYVALYNGSPGENLLAGLDVGRAVSDDGIVWTRDSIPVMSYESRFIAASTFLMSSDGYEAFYTYGIGNDQAWKFGYATSSDGRDWNMNYPMPLFSKTGLYLAYVCESENNPTYRMWYGYRFGQFIEDALSLKGYSGLSTPLEPYLVPGLDTFKVTVNQTGNHSDLELIAQVSALSGESSVDLVLYDDGVHADSEANDNVYGNYWPVPDLEDIFVVDIAARNSDSTIITYNDVGSFTSAGPVVFTELEQVHPTGGAIVPNSTIYFYVSVQNLSLSRTIENVYIDIQSSDSSTIPGSYTRAMYPDIGPGEVQVGLEYFSLRIASDIAVGTPIYFDMIIYSEGFKCWEETVQLLGYVGVYKDGLALPAKYDLNENFPNPFNPSTTISYQLPEMTNVELAIYDIAGRNVRTLVKREQSAGIYFVKWEGIDNSGKSVSTGVYLCRMDCGDFSKTFKMLYLK